MKHKMTNYSKIAHKVKDKQICPICGKKKAYTAKRCNKCFYKSLIGHKNNLGCIPWNKGKGNSKLDRKIRALGLFSQWRETVYKKSNRKCQTCQMIPNKLEAHHIIPFKVLLKKFNIKTIQQAQQCEELWSVDNGVALCQKCHALTKQGSRTS